MIIVIWWLLAPQMGLIKLPRPGRVFTVTVDSLFQSKVIAAQGGGSAGLAPHLLHTIFRTFVGAAIGIAVGVGVGLLMGWSEFARDLLQPSLEGLRLVPSLVAVPFLLLWFGLSPWAQLGVIIYTTFVMLQVNTLNAIRNVAPRYRQFAMTLGASRWEVFRTVVLPAIVPEVTGGLRVVLALAWGAEVTAEIIGAQVGVGRVMRSMQAIFRTDVIIAAIIWIVLIAVVTDRILVLILSRKTRWVPRAERL